MNQVDNTAIDQVPVLPEVVDGGLPKFEDSDDDREVDAEESLHFILRFGKHQGSTLGAVARTKAGRDYLRYLLQWSALKTFARVHIAAVIEMYMLQKK